MDGGNVIFNFEGDDSKLKSMVSTLGSGIVKSAKVAVVGITAVSTAMVGLIGYGVKYNAEIEQYTTSFEVMTSSATKASQIVDKLKKMGAATPFEFKDLANTTNLLMSFGFESSKAIDTLSMLGDISQGSAEKLNTVARAFGKMSSAQKVGLEDINMMIDSGFNPLQEISESTGESMKKLYDRISKGSMSVDEITKSMQRSTSVGGKYFQSMEKQSKTLNGQISTLKDNFDSFAGALAKSTSNILASGVLPQINKWMQELQASFETGNMDIFGAKLGNILSQAVTSIATSMPQIINMGVLVIQSLLTGIQNNLPAISKGIFDIIMAFANGIMILLPMIITIGTQLITSLAEGIKNNSTAIISGITSLITLLADTIITLLPVIFELGANLIIALMTGLANALENDKQFGSKIANVIWKIIEIFFKYMPYIVNLGIKIINSLIQGLLLAGSTLVFNIMKLVSDWIITPMINGLGKMYSIGNNIVTGLWNGITSGKNWLLQKVTDFANSIINKIKNTLGIHSPSRVMMELGEYVDKGFIKGVLGMQTDVTKAFNNTFDIAPNVTRTANMNYSANVIVNNNINSSFDSLGQVVNSVRTFANGSKNDYSYAGG